MMALAFADPQKIKEAVRGEGEVKDQAEALGLETEVWWDD